MKHPTLKKVLALLILILAIPFLYYFIANNRPAVGPIQSDKLPECQRAPNCISTSNTNSTHATAPLPGGPHAIATLKTLIETHYPNAHLVKSTPDYLHFVFTSKRLKFKDDLILYQAPNTNTVQIRSASRVGYSDLGVNRARIESIRSLYLSAQK
ncbi:MAG: hypothetical protein S4CHLAM102_13500 [Chlamydiia bacterium]|nr:hypothetical protein [Chlamydiia bacterium]